MSDISERLSTMGSDEKRLLLAQLLQKQASKSTSFPPLSYGQRALWFLYQSAPESAAYNVALHARIRSRVDVPALQCALQALINRHASLRTTFPAQDGQAMQQVHGYQKVCFEHIDASTWTWDELNQQVAKAYQRPFDLEQGPLLRVSLFTCSVQDHVLLLAFHHIVGDGWSIRILLNDLGDLYQAEQMQTQASLPPLLLSYADYVRWQADMLKGSEGQRLRTYWQQQLAGELPVLNLPTDRPHPPVQTFHGASYTFTLSEDLTQRLKGLAQPEGVTLYMILLAAWYVQLFRYTDQEDILVGSPTLGRTQPGFTEIVGYFVNTVVLRANLAGNPTFKNLLSQVRHIVLNAITHQDYPFALLVEQLQPQRDPTRSPIFQGAFLLQTSLQSGEITDALMSSPTNTRVTWAGLELEPFALPQQEGLFDLTLHIIETQETLFGIFNYSRDLFDATTIHRMAKHFETLLEGVVACPEQRLSALPLLSEAERHQLLVEWNATQAAFSHDACLPQVFAAQVARTPEAVAVVEDDQQLTYAALNRRANQLAHHLRALGVGPEVLVGLCLERSLEMVVGLLGILKAGGAYVPLDPTYPAERLAFMLADAQVSVLVTQASLVARLPPSQARVVCVETAWEHMAQERVENPASAITPENLAYVIYTSGSTGRPKGVAIAHRGVGNLAAAQIRAFGIQAASRVLQFASLSFDASLSEIVMTLCAGARLCLATPDAVLPGPGLVQVMREQAITHVTLPPSTLAVLPPDAFPELHTIIVAGEACPAHLVAQWSPGRRFLNAYGPTEATVCATVATCTDAQQRPPIGRPIMNTHLYLLTSHRQPVPIGVPGELHLGGIGLARGYLNRPQLTAERFIPSPFSAVPGARLYATGDLARYLPDGNLDYLGRLDQQVKLRGFRIELEEIEHVLGTHPGVGEAVVLTTGDTQSERALVAYVTRKKPVELWPSIAEFFVYDEVVYRAMASHEFRNHCYLAAFQKVLPGKKVVEIGPGPEVILSRLSLEAGAEKVYAIELLEGPYRQAQQTVQALGLEERIILMHGDATAIELPEQVDYCISEIVGSIGGAEGAAKIINHARRFLHDPHCMIPQRSLAKIAAITLSEHDCDYSFPEIAAHYVERIFEQVGYPFDLRVCLKNLPRTNIISTTDVFEDLDYTTETPLESTHAITLICETNASCTGFLVWLTLYTDQHNILDTLEQQESWLPVYLPVFEPGVAVSKGDVIYATVSRRLGGNNLNPDYFIAGRIERQYGKALTFHYSSYHCQPVAKGSPFYAKLFAGDKVPVQPRLSSNALRTYLGSHLPAYMIPSHFVELQRFPVTPNGKIDRRALPAPTLSQRGLETGFVALHTPMEEVLASLWADVLELEQVGSEDNFFDLGGHSLLATQLVSRIWATFGVELPVRYVFEAPTIAELSVCIDAARGVHQRPLAPPITPVARTGDLPLSFAQQRLWFLEQLEGQSATYNLPAALRLTGRLHVAALAASLTALVRRHEALRTTFAAVQGVPVQVIGPSHPRPLPVVDVQALSAARQAAEVQRLATAEAQRPFALAHGPLLRATLLRLGEDDHVLLVTLHHSVADGWSLGILVREVTALYTAGCRDEPAALPSLPLQYADFASWQRRWLHGEVLERHVAYWRAQLAGAPAVLELPTDRPRPPVQTFRGGIEPMHLPPELTQQLQRLSRQAGATLFMTLLGAFAVLLTRYSGQADIVIGSPIANRSRQETEGLIGFFVNTLALRLDLSGDPTFHALLGQVRQVALGSYVHQDLPFEKLVEELQLVRNLSHAPLFQVMFIFQNTPRKTLTLPGLTLSLLAIESATAKFDVTLTMEETEQRLLATWEYNRDLFDVATIRRMMGHFQHLLEGLVAYPEQRVSTVPMLTEAERQQLLVAWNDTQVAYPQDISLHQAFEAQVARTPEAVAVVCDDQHLTYRALHCRANQTAYYLQAVAGVGPEVRVGICMERSLGMITGILGILKAGGAYVPLDPTYPQARLAFMLADAQVLVLLTQERLRAGLPEHHAQVICLDADWHRIAQESEETPRSQGTAETLAYVIYTSGSTGRPKGVMITHQAVGNTLRWLQETFALARGDVVAQKTSASFTDSVWEFFWTLMTGAKLTIIPDEAVKDPALLYHHLRSRNVTVTQFVPPQMTAFLAAVHDIETPDPLPSLQWVFNGGEALPVHTTRTWYARFQQAKIANIYGMTESAIYATHHRIAVSPEPSARSLPLGKPIANATVYILDKDGRLCPPPTIGEICIGGISLARGYLQQPELTAASFIPHPFSEVPGARLYRTGDVGRYLPDGTLEYLGRIDHQVQIRGFRVELGEIESILESHPAVRSVVVLAREDEPGEKRLVAYVVPYPEHDLSARALRHFLQEHLPVYMIPTAFALLAALPLTPNGKVDRRALPVPEPGQSVPATGLVVPRTPTEALLADLWADVLRLDTVGMDDNFFDLGGHSLLATQLISRLRLAFSVELSVRQIFEFPTVAELSAYIDIAFREAQGSLPPPIRSVTRTTDMPLSFAQQRLWFLDQLEGESATYNLPAALRLCGPLDVALLAASLGALMQRHEALRTSFPTAQGVPVQRIAPRAALALSVVEMQALPAASQAAEVQRLARAEAQRSFALAHGPLLRATLLRLGAADHVLLVSMHHIVSDGWSMGILVREVATLYAAACRGEPARLPPLPVQYADFAHWQRAWLQGEVLERQLAYWRAQLAVAPAVLELPTDRPRPLVQSFRGGLVPFALDGELTQELVALGRQAGVTLYMTLLGAFATLLSRYSNQEDVVIGSPIANRNRRETEGLIGFFVNLLPLRIDLSKDPTFDELLARVRQVTLEAYAHQDIPFEKLVEELQPERDISYTPLFQVVFALQNAPMEKVELPGLSLTMLPMESGTAKFDLTLSMEETAQSLHGVWEYNSDLFEAATIHRMAGHFHTLLEQIVQSSGD